MESSQSPIPPSASVEYQLSLIEQNDVTKEYIHLFPSFKGWAIRANYSKGDVIWLHRNQDSGEVIQVRYVVDRVITTVDMNSPSEAERQITFTTNVYLKQEDRPQQPNDPVNYKRVFLNFNGQRVEVG